MFSGLALIGASQPGQMSSPFKKLKISYSICTQSEGANLILVITLKLKVQRAAREHVLRHRAQSFPGGIASLQEELLFVQ